MSTPIMITGVTTYDDVRIIDSIVDEGEQGIFLNSARLVDQVLRDARIYSTMTTRIGGLLGKPLEFEPGDTGDGRKKSTAEKYAEDIKSDWPKMLEHSTLVELLTWGLMQGVGVAQIIEDEDLWRLEVWHPWALTWDEFERQYYIQTREDSRLYILPDGKGGFRDQNGTRWVLFTPFGFGNSGRRCYLRCLHRLSNERSWSHRDRARFSEIFGQAIRFGYAPENATKEERAEFKKRLRLGGEPVIVANRGQLGNQWGVELVQTNGTSTELFDVTLTQLDKEIATLFLGQSQTTDGQAGLGANELAGEPVRLDMMSADAEALSGCLRQQFLRPYYEFSYGDGELAPWPCWRVDPPEDRAKKSLEFKQLMEGIAAAKKASIPIDERAILEDYGVPALSKDEQAAVDAAAQRAAQDAAAAAAAQKKPPADAGQGAA